MSAVGSVAPDIIVLDVVQADSLLIGSAATQAVFVDHLAPLNEVVSAKQDQDYDRGEQTNFQEQQLLIFF